MARTTNQANRPRLDVSRGVKARVNDLKKRRQFDKDTDLVAYLLALYEATEKDITIVQDMKLRKLADDLNRQEIF